MLASELGFQILMQPSQEEERNVSLATRFQCTAKTSRACSCHEAMGYVGTLMSKSFTEPSPQAVRSWFSWDSDQVLSKRESWVSNLRLGMLACERRGKSSWVLRVPRTTSRLLCHLL